MPYTHFARRALIATAFTLSCIPQAQAETQHGEQVWATLSSSGSVKGKVIYSALIQSRSDSLSELRLLMLRGAVGVKVSPKITLFQGYAHFSLPVAGGRDLVEEHSFQQMNIALGKPLGGDLSSRTHLEQRWRSDGKDMALRLHQVLRYAHPLGGDPKAFNVLFYGEGLVSLNKTDWNGPSGLDQVRGFVGAEIGLPGASTLEVGYLNQTVNRPHKRIVMNNILAATLIYRH